MYLSLPSLSLALSAFSSFGGARVREAEEALPRFKHEAIQVEEKRQLVNPPMEGPPAAFAETTTTAPQILTFFTPSPSAAPIAITQQSQVETSYVPQFTLCALPPLAFVRGTFPVTAATGGPTYRNYSVTTPPGNGTCQTEYSPTPTTICATTITGITSKVTISECDQEVTFSSHYGYTLVFPTPTSAITASANISNSSITTAMPSIRTLTTYYVAPWQDLTTAGPPSDVEVKICNTYENGTVVCVHEQQVWAVQVLTITSVTTSHVDLTTTVPGPARLMIETIHMDITTTVTTLSLSTALVLDYEVETESTSVSTKVPTSAEPTTTHTITSTIVRTVEVNPTPQQSTTKVTQTITTIFGGTSTVTVSDEPTPV